MLCLGLLVIKICYYFTSFCSQQSPFDHGIVLFVKSFQFLVISANCSSFLWWFHKDFFFFLRNTLLSSWQVWWHVVSVHMSPKKENKNCCPLLKIWNAPKLGSRRTGFHGLHFIANSRNCAIAMTMKKENEEELDFFLAGAVW